MHSTGRVNHPAFCKCWNVFNNNPASFIVSATLVSILFMQNDDFRYFLNVGVLAFFNDMSYIYKAHVSCKNFD